MIIRTRTHKQTQIELYTLCIFVCFPSSIPISHVYTYTEAHHIWIETVDLHFELFSQLYFNAKQDGNDKWVWNSFNHTQFFFTPFALAQLNAWQRQDFQIWMISVISINSPERLTTKKKKKKIDWERERERTDFAHDCKTIYFQFGCYLFCYFRRDVYYIFHGVEWLFSVWLFFLLACAFLCVRFHPFSNTLSWCRWLWTNNESDPVEGILMIYDCLFLILFCGF